MTPKQRPYVCVTGFSSLAEVEAFEATVRGIAMPASHDLRAGVLVSDATFRGEPSRMPRYADRATAYALLERLRRCATPVVHFNTRDPRPLGEQVLELFRHEHAYENGACRAVQLNVPWPAEGELRTIREQLPEVRVILQVPLWRDENRDPAALQAHLERYPGLVDDLLLDPSGGRGTEIEPALLALAANVQRWFESVFCLGIAGGLTGQNVRQVVALTAQALGHREFSVDTEGKVRGGTFEGRRVGDAVNPEKVALYLREAIAAL